MRYGMKQEWRNGDRGSEGVYWIKVPEFVCIQDLKGNKKILKTHFYCSFR